MSGADKTVWRQTVLPIAVVLLVVLLAVNAGLLVNAVFLAEETRFEESGFTMDFAATAFITEAAEEAGVAIDPLGAGWTVSHGSGDMVFNQGTAEYRMSPRDAPAVLEIVDRRVRDALTGVGAAVMVAMSMEGEHGLSGVELAYTAERCRGIVLIRTNRIDETRVMFVTFAIEVPLVPETP